MSFSDAIGQIDQIVQWEQQLMDPTAATQTTSTGGTTATGDTGSTSSTDASSNSTFAQTLAQAQAQEATSAATSTDSTTAASLDPTATAADADALGSTSSSSLLGGGDSQLLSLLSGLNSSSADEAAGATSSTGSSDELSQLEQALQASNTSATGSTASALVEGESGISGGEATSADDPRIQAMTEEANALVGKPYVWGGGHDGWNPSTGYDCSGFVSAVLHAGGYLSTPQDTTTLPGAPDMAAGPGQYVTVYDRAKSGQQGHVIINIDGQFYEAGGQAGSWGGGGGVEQIATPSAKYLSTFDTILHPAGL